MAFAVPRAGADVPLFDVPRLEGISVDGDPQDWGESGFRVEALTPTSHPVPPASDLHAAFRLGWNERGLLILVSVTDDAYAEAEDEGRLWSGDSIEFYLSPGKGSPDIYQLVISPGMAEATPDLRQHLYDNRRDSTLLQTSAPAVLARISKTNSYVLEALLPFENLDIVPVNGSQLAFQLAANDVDLQEERFQLLWYPLPGSSTVPRTRSSLCSAPKPWSMP